MNLEKLKSIACQIRKDIIVQVSEAGSGHPGGSLSAADILTVLYFHQMNVDPTNLQLEGRDKFVLSKGHGAPALYATLAEKGFFPKEELKYLRKINHILQGHPDRKKVPGVEMSTGSLGQGFSASVGMGLANKLDKNPGRVYVLLGDGELQEGIVWEAAMAAGHYKLDNLTAFLDYNGLQIDGKNSSVMTVDPVGDKFEAFGWNVLYCDGHDMTEINDSIEKAKATEGQPTIIIAKTIKGKGVSFMEDQAGWHGKAPNAEETKIALEELGGCN